MDPLAIIGTIAVLGTVVKAVIDAARRQWPRLDGFLVQVAAAGLGTATAWALDVRGTAALVDYLGVSTGRTPPAAADYLITGIAIAAGAGVIAELAGRSGKPPAVVEVTGTDLTITGDGRHLG